MLDVIEVANEYYVRARSSLADTQTRVLMQGDLFGVFDRHGDFQPAGFTEQGLFYEEARHLSRLVLRLPGDRLWLLSSTVREDNAILAIDLTNPELGLLDGRRLLYGTIHIIERNFSGAMLVTNRFAFITTVYFQFPCSCCLNSVPTSLMSLNFEVIEEKVEANCWSRRRMTPA